MADLRIDLDALSAMQSDLQTIHAEFDGAEEMSDIVAGYVGHARLEGVVHDFAGRWNIHRRELLEKLDYIASAVEAIHDTMLETDQKLAESLAILDTAAPN